MKSVANWKNQLAAGQASPSEQLSGEFWQEVREGLQKHLGAERFARWFAAVHLHFDDSATAVTEGADGTTDGESLMGTADAPDPGCPCFNLVLGVPNLFIRDWIEQRYSAVLKDVIAARLDEWGGELGRLRVRVAGSLFQEHRKAHLQFQETRRHDAHSSEAARGLGGAAVSLRIASSADSRDALEADPSDPNLDSDPISRGSRIPQGKGGTVSKGESAQPFMPAHAEVEAAPDRNHPRNPFQGNSNSTAVESGDPRGTPLAELSRRLDVGVGGVVELPAERRGLEGLNSRLTLESYVVGTSNNVAYQASLDVLGRPGLTYNPLFIFGPSGVGKTHLLQGITRRFFQQGVRKIRYLSAEGFSQRFVRAIQDRRMENFRARFHKLEVLVLDDVQSIGKKTRTQEALLQAVDDILAAGGQVILASDTRPQVIDGLNPQLRGRMVAGLLCKVDAPDYPTRVAILRQELARTPVTMHDGVLHRIAELCHRNVRELHGGFVKVLAYRSLMNEAVAPERVEQILRDHVTPSRDLSLPGITATVSQRYAVSVEAILSETRMRRISAARQIAMYLCRELTGYSLVEIGDFFGKRNHATVNFAIRRVLARLRKDAEFQSELNELANTLRQGV